MAYIVSESNIFVEFCLPYKAEMSVSVYKARVCALIAKLELENASYSHTISVELFDISAYHVLISRLARSMLNSADKIDRFARLRTSIYGSINNTHTHTFIHLFSSIVIGN